MKLYNAQHPDGIDLGPSSAEPRYDENGSRGIALKVGRMAASKETRGRETRGRPRKQPLMEEPNE